MLRSTFLSARVGPALAVALFSAIPAAYTTGALAADGPFQTLSGGWDGAGTITMADGKSERMRCRVNYDVTSTGTSLKQSLNCTSDSYKFELTSTVNQESKGISGYWTEKSRNINGKLSGKANADEIAALVEASGFVATLNVKTRGDKQTVYIKSPSTDIRDISINLSRK